jgi:hypothetical protein
VLKTEVNFKVPMLLSTAERNVLETISKRNLKGKGKSQLKSLPMYTGSIA